MKKEDFTKLGVDEDTAFKCEKAFFDELKGYIPKARFDEVNTEKKRLESELLERSNQLDGLKNSNADLKELKKQIEELQADNKAKDENHSKEIKQLKIDNAIDSVIASAKGKNVKAIRALLDMGCIELADDGTIKGISEQIENLTKSDDSSFLFDNSSNKPSIKGAEPGDYVKPGDNSVDLSKMTYSELAAYMAENPEVTID